MKHIEKAFSFLRLIFQAADKMRPNEKYWHIKGMGFDYYINEKYTHRIGIGEIYQLFSNPPKNGKEKLN